MEWSIFQGLVLLVSFLGGFITGSWKLSGMLATITEKLRAIEEAIKTFTDVEKRVTKLETRVEYLERENAELNGILKIILQKLGDENEPKE